MAICHAIDSTVEKVSETLGWFHNEKCHLLVLNCKQNPRKIVDEEITGSTSIKLQGITIDHKLNYKGQATKI